MRRLLPLLSLLAACQCAPPTPTAVTLRLTNTLDRPIFVDATDGRFGMVLERAFGDEWLAFDEEPACACLACEEPCAGCDCPAGRAPRVLRLAPGERVERTWRGQVQVPTSARCPGDVEPSPCVWADNPLLEETLRVRLCISQAAPGLNDAPSGEAVPGALEAKSLACRETEFRVIDGTVDVSPVAGPACARHADCHGAQELCLLGACTAACPDVGLPEPGGAWQLRIPAPDDQGFFDSATTGGVTTSTGTGRLGAVRHENDTTRLTLLRDLPGGGSVVATLRATLPHGVAAPFRLGETLQVTVVDASTPANPENRGLLVRDADGRLLLAASTEQGGPVLAAGDTAPFTVARSADIVGCRHTECGRRLQQRTEFRTATVTLALAPGEIADVVVAGVTFQLVNVDDARYESTSCSLAELMPWAIVNLRPENPPP